MQRAKASFLVILAGLATIPLAIDSAEACLTCTAEQQCTSGNQGSSCTMEIVDGKLWCQFTLDCSTRLTLTPLQVSPAGTYLDGGDARVVEDGFDRVACNGFIVAATSTAPSAAGTAAIRI